jgi:hypothetical protein
MKQIQFFLIAFLLSTCGAFAQSTSNVTGGNAKINNSTYSYSVGEMTMVSTLSSSNLIVTQGLLQPFQNAPTSTDDLIISKDQLNVYPNPTKGIVNIAPKFTTGGTLQLDLLDMSGKRIQRKQIKLMNGTEKQEIDMSSFSNGNYMLNVNFDGEKGLQKNNYKIQKLKQ